MKQRALLIILSIFVVACSPGGSATSDMVTTALLLNAGTDSVSVASAASATPAEATYLFGHDNVNHTMIKIDIQTGLAEVVGPTTFQSGASGMATSTAAVPGPGGVTYSPGTHFGLIRDGSVGKDFVVVVDLTTGAATRVVETARTIGGRGIAFGADGSTLYVLEGNILSTIDVVTGNLTEIGRLGEVSASSLEFEPNDGFFYAIAGQNLIKIDPVTARATLIKQNLGVSACTLARSPETGIWYTVNTATKELVSLDIASGDVTIIGNLGAAASGSICGSAFAPQKPVSIVAPVDIKPGSCPNPVQMNRCECGEHHHHSHGKCKAHGDHHGRHQGCEKSDHHESDHHRSCHSRLPVAVAGTDVFDTSLIDATTVTLAGVSPLRYDYEDVATPFEPYTGKQDAMDCTTQGADGVVDLTLKFDRQEVIDALETQLDRELVDGETIVVPLKAELNDGTSIEGEDVILIRKKGHWGHGHHHRHHDHHTKHHNHH